LSLAFIYYTTAAAAAAAEKSLSYLPLHDDDDAVLRKMAS
jgi:cbb3-type cytochrome oxidase subunit 3